MVLLLFAAYAPQHSSRVFANKQHTIMQIKTEAIMEKKIEPELARTLEDIQPNMTQHQEPPPRKTEQKIREHAPMAASAACYAWRDTQNARTSLPTAATPGRLFRNQNKLFYEHTRFYMLLNLWFP
jgi:hypothetical protein